MFSTKSFRTRALASTAAVGLMVAGLGACSSGTGSAGSSGTCVGEWDLVSMSADGESVGAEELAQFEEMGLKISLSVEADGAATLSFFGEDEVGTWSDAPGGCTLKMSAEEIPAKVADGLLSINQDGAEVTFSKAN